VPNLTVVAMPQPEGGVQVKIRGNDFDGVQARQTEWLLNRACAIVVVGVVVASFQKPQCSRL
jgi:hypothetical protein